MKIKSAKSFRTWFKTIIKEIEKDDPTQNENFERKGQENHKSFF